MKLMREKVDGEGGKCLSYIDCKFISVNKEYIEY